MPDKQVELIKKKRGIGSIVNNPKKSCLQIRDISRGLIIKNNDAFPDHKIDVNVEEIILEDIDYNTLRATGLSLTLDIAKIGINGIDIGTETPYTWYYIWIIAMSDGTVGGVLSSSSTNPRMPLGYIYKSFAGAVHNCINVGNDFGLMKQIGNVVGRNAVAVINSGIANAPTQINCALALPEKAVKAMGDITLNIAPGGGRGAGWVRSAPDQGCVEFAGYLNAQGRLTVPFCIPVIESQTLYYNRDSSSNAESITISISGFEF